MSSTHSSSKTSSNGGASATDSAEAVRAAAAGQHPERKDAREEILDDMKSIIDKAEDWLASTAADSGAELRDVKEKFNLTLQTAKTDLLKIEASMLARTKLAAKTTDTYVHDHPWQSVALGAAVGVVLGLLISRD